MVSTTTPKVVPPVATKLIEEQQYNSFCLVLWSCDGEIYCPLASKSPRVHSCGRQAYRLRAKYYEENEEGNNCAPAHRIRA